MSPLTHPDFPGWELSQFSETQCSPRSCVPVRYGGVIVGLRHDHDREKPERVTAISARPEALERVKAFYDAVMSAQKARRELESARFAAKRAARDREAVDAADRALGLMP